MSLIKRSLSLYGHSTSLAMEVEYWRVIDFTAQRGGLSVAALIKRLDDDRIDQRYGRGLAAFIRVWAVNQIIYDDEVREALKINSGAVKPMQQR